jgi:hypothetical protein
MRVLVLTHPRSGGRSLLSWICQELNFKFWHEPTLEDYNEILTEKNIAVKDFPHRITEAGYDIDEFASKFDKVILHSRGDARDIAISLVYAIEATGNNTDYKHHDLYRIDDEWINERESEIQRMTIHSNELLNDIKNVNIDCLITTYDGVFYNKTDVEKISNYLGIKKHHWLDVLDNKRRLRNGEIGMYNTKSSKTLI